ncbi:MAG: DNRLRE domain-containing protein [Verrucomicrobiaceae bacterium]|nr:MAG: DNRLRE domain-containing protein [Verrucomicrobiaceae bacterium]
MEPRGRSNAATTAKIGGFMVRTVDSRRIAGDSEKTISGVQIRLSLPDRRQRYHHSLFAMKAPAIRHLLVATFLSTTASAVTLPASEDSSSSKGNLTAAGHKATTLPVSASRRAFVFFDTSQLPANASIRYARLRVYVPKLSAAGNGLQVHQVTGAWSESAVSAEPAFNPAPLGTIPANQLPAKGFASVDVTNAVKAWIATPSSNEGLSIAAVPAPSTANLTLGSKEGSSTGYPAELEVELDAAKVVIQGNGGSTYQLVPSGNNLVLQHLSGLSTIPMFSIDGTTNAVRVGSAGSFISRGDNSVGIDGAFSFEAANFTSNFNANDSTCVFFGNTNSNNVTITLPSATGRSGRVYFIKKTSANNTLTIATTGGNTIDGAASVVLAANNACRVVMSNGTNWFVISAL